MKKVIKIIIGVVLALLCAFMFLVRCGKPTSNVIVHASNNVVSYAGSVVIYNSDDDESPDNNDNYCPKQLYYNVDLSNQSFNYQIGSINYYDNYNNQYYINVYFKSFYTNAIGLFLSNGSQEYFLCYYNIGPNGAVYSYTPQYYFSLSQNTGGIITIPSIYTYELVNSSNPLNFTLQTLLAYQTWDSNLPSLFDNHILVAGSSDSNDAYNVGLSQGYDQGVNSVLLDPNNYDLYTQSQYESYGSSQYAAGQQADMSTNGFRILMSTIFNAPYQILQPILNFELLGVNLWNLFTFIISIFVVIFFIRLFKGGGQ